MKFRKGSYELGDFETLLQEFSIEPTYAERSDVMAGYRKSLRIRGFVEDATQDGLKTKIVALEAAFRIPNEDVGIVHDDGSTPSAHYIEYAPGGSDVNLSGVRLASLRWIEGQGIEYADGGGRRTFEAAWYADYESPDSDHELIEFEDTFQIQGNAGPRYGFTDYLAEQQEKVLLQNHTTTRAVQSGYALGRTTYPAAATPLFAGDLVNEQTATGRRSPKRQRGTIFRGYAQTWNYSYERTVSFGTVSP